jgi:hypothetical protein
VETSNPPQPHSLPDMILAQAAHSRLCQWWISFRVADDSCVDRSVTDRHGFLTEWQGRQLKLLPREIGKPLPTCRD